MAERALTLRESLWLPDWYIIEWEDGRRVSDADVEGTSAEMLAIADAIEARSSVAFKRCAVQTDGGVVRFCSPRNCLSAGGEVPMATADALASVIRRVVGGGKAPPPVEAGDPGEVSGG